MNYLFVIDGSHQWESVRAVFTELLERSSITARYVMIDDLSMHQNRLKPYGFIVDDSTDTLIDQLSYDKTYSLIVNPSASQRKILQSLNCDCDKNDLRGLRSILNPVTMTARRSVLRDLKYPKIFRTRTSIYKVNDSDTANILCDLHTHDLSVEDCIEHYYSIRCVFVFNKFMGSYRVERPQNSSGFKTERSSTPIVYNPISTGEQIAISMIENLSEIPLLELNYTMIDGHFVLFGYNHSPDLLLYGSLGFTINLPAPNPITGSSINDSIEQIVPVVIDLVASVDTDDFIIPESVELDCIGLLKLNSSDDNFISSQSVSINGSVVRVLLGESYFYMNLDETGHTQIITGGKCIKIKITENTDQPGSINLTTHTINSII